MARPRSEDKRNAIMTAATRVIVAEGLGAPTALIAQKAGVANGTLFTYFKTKAELYNQLYLELKGEMAGAALAGIPAKSGFRDRMLHVWSSWVGWAVSNPEKRRALAQLSVCEDITPASKAAAHRAMADIAELMERMRSRGPMKDAPKELVGALMNSLAETTMDFMIRDPVNAANHCKVGFDAFWRAFT
jgi:AcrR family transcriptional regulator